MVDKSLQKGFLSVVNGCIEHVFAIQSIINAMDHSLPLSLSFIDLKNAFGSISHNYISDIIKLIKLPTQFTRYLTNLYSSISAHISTKDWKAQPFPISMGVFQGDTLSPLLLLIAFNPIIQSVVIHPSRGFSLKLPNHTESNQHTLPCQNSHIYALWEENNSKETLGWYLARVLTVDNLGRTNSCTRRVDTQRRSVFSKLSGHQQRVMGNGSCLIFVTHHPQFTKSNLFTLRSTASHARSKGMQMT